MKSELFVAWYCSPVSPLFSIGLETEEPDALARLGDKVRQAEDILASWVRGARGMTLASIGMQGAFRVPSDQINDLGRIIDELQAYVGLDYHFGIGIDLREAFYAVQAAQRKQEPYCFFTEDVLKELQEKEESQTLDQRLGESDNVTNERSAEDRDGVQKSEAVVPVEPQGGEIQPEVDPNAETRKLIVDALQRIKEHSGSLEGLAATNPEALAAVHGVVQAMVMMAHWLRDGNAVQKSEELFKKLHLPAPKKLKTQLHNPMTTPETPPPSAMAGTIRDGKIKGTSNEDKTKWHGARAGAVMGPTGVAVSSREPQAK